MPRFVRVPIVCFGLAGLIPGCGSDDVARVDETPAPTPVSVDPAAKGRRAPKGADVDAVGNIQVR